MAGRHAMSSGILITAVAPSTGSRASEHSTVVVLGRVEVSHPDGALLPALPLLCWRVWRMLMLSTSGRCMAISSVQACSTFLRNSPYGDSAGMFASTAALATT
eukprot:4291439-Heterocapsa_arctica.AAC.1